MWKRYCCASATKCARRAAERQTPLGLPCDATCAAVARRRAAVGRDGGAAGSAHTGLGSDRGPLKRGVAPPP
eukprot:760676-Prymnesium_polylepis.2